MMSSRPLPMSPRRGDRIGDPERRNVGSGSSGLGDPLPAPVGGGLRWSRAGSPLMRD